MIVQIITGIADGLALQLDVPAKAEILKDLLRLELLVQIVEGIFYTWLAINMTKVINITPIRYVDWFITTPTMLITLVCLLIYLNRKGNMPGETLYSVTKENKKQLLIIVALNALMLSFGLLGELGYINNTLDVFLGFLPLIGYYYLIYTKYVKDNTHKYSKPIFYFFFITWSIYGIVALLPYTAKNIGYNFLDLISKNLFGIVLSLMVFHIQVRRNTPFVV